jgi:hypothetical protein
MQKLVADGAACSHGQEIHVDARCFGQGPQVSGVGSHDVVAVGGKANESGIDRILSPAAAQQHARLLAQLPVLPRDETWPSWLVPT